MKVKTNNRDFTYESLPKTRREQYRQILKDNFPLLVKIGCFCFLFLLPLLIAFFFKESYLRGIYADESLDLDKKASLSLSIEIIFNAVYIVAISVFFIGLNGILKVFRRLLWNEPLFFKEDFLLGIKDNFGQSILTGFLVGLFYFISFLILRFASDWLRILGIVFTSLSFAILIPILIQSFYLSSIYKNSFKTSFGVSLRLFLRRGFLFILPLLIIYAFYFVEMIPLGILYLLLIFIVLFVFLLPILILMSYSVNIKILDDYINSYYYPEMAYLGLYVSKEKKDKILENVEKVKQKNTF